MKSILVIFIVSLCFVYGFSFKYGQKSRSHKPKCDEFNPPALKHVNFDDFAGKYYSIRAKSPCIQRNGPTLVGTVEFLHGKSAAIRNFRLKNNPTFCVIALREFIPIKHTDGSKFSLFLEDDNLTVEWRLLHFDSEFAISWACFKKDKYGKCIDWASGLLRKTPDVNISHKDFTRLDRIIREKTCKTITDQYEIREIQTKCRDWSLPSKGKYIY